MPAQELSEAGKYLAAAYGVFVALLLIYFTIMAAKLSRIERQLIELNDLARGEARESAAEPEKEPV
jgi:hypothetical protein